MRRIKFSAIARVFPVGLALILSTLSPQASSSPAGADGVTESPIKQMLVVAVNAAEVHSDADNRRTLDLGNFARRLKRLMLLEDASEKIPAYEPDVFLVSEVKLKTARNLVTMLNRYGPGGDVDNPPSKYVLDAPPAVTFPRVEGTESTPRHHRSNAIIINSDTVTPGSKLQWLDMTYPKSEVCEPPRIGQVGEEDENQCTGTHEWATKEIPYRNYREVTNAGEGMAISTISTHMKPQKALKYPEGRHNIWIEEQLEFLKEKSPQDAVPVIGGDMNNKLCRDNKDSTDPDCEPTLMWRTLQGSKYKTAVSSGIDHIFTPGALISSGKDRSNYSIATKCSSYFEEDLEPNGIPENCRRDYYSDHVMVWALIGPE